MALDKLNAISVKKNEAEFSHSFKSEKMRFSLTKMREEMRSMIVNPMIIKIVSTLAGFEDSVL